MLNRLFLQIHRYVGLVTLVFLLVAGATGVLLCFETPLDALLNPALFQARRAGETLGPLALAAQVQRRDPRLMLTQAPLSIPPGRSLELKVAAWPGTPALGYSEVFVDPASGRIQGMRSEAPGFDPAHLMRGVYFLHYTLLAGDAGRWFMAVIALGWLLNNLIGLYLTLPRGPPFWPRWRPVWVVNFKAKAPRLLLDLHRASGLWLFMAITVTAFTSAALNSYSEMVEPVARAISPPRPAAWEADDPPADPVRRPTLGFAEAEAKALAAARRDGLTLRPAAMTYNGGLGLYGLRFTSDGRLDWKGLGPVTYYVDDRRGALAAVDNPLKDSGGRMFLRSLYPLHSGEVGGMATRLLVCLVGLATVEMAGSGLYVWWRRRPPRVAARAARRLRSAGGQG